MIKYVDTKVVFQEIPDETTLAINISNCPCHCKGCHSSYLAEDIGTPLDEDSLVELLLNNKGITCIAFMGGDSDPEYINWLASIMRDMNDSEPGNWADVKIAWYSGRQELSPDIDLRNFDYIKLGPYIEEKGPLSSRTTNQVMLQIDNSCGRSIVKDITSRFWK
jgi:anaerobic ribonucleoside-triphosphate reductase activating protein